MISHTLNNRKRGKYFLFGDKLGLYICTIKTNLLKIHLLHKYIINIHVALMLTISNLLRKLKNNNINPWSVSSHYMKVSHKKINNFSDKIIHVLTYSHLSKINLTKNQHSDGRGFNKILHLMLSNYSNGCSATYAIRPPPMSHTPSITIIFLECVRHPRSSRVSIPTLATNKPNCIAILSSKVNNFCSTQLPTVAWWLGLIRWTIWMIKTDLFQNLPIWRCLGQGTPPPSPFPNKHTCNTPCGR